MPEDTTLQIKPVSTRRFSAAHAAAFVLILLAGAGLRCWQLDRESIWWDEFTSVVHLDPPAAWQASPDFTRWNQSVIRDTAPSLLAFWKQNRSMDPATMPMYYTFEYLWTRHISNDFETLRYLSILISMLVLPAAWLLGRTFFGRGAGLTVMLCVALSPIHWQFAREIRMYGLMTLLAALSVWTFAHLVRGGGKRWWAAHGAATLLLLWTHPFAVLVPFTEGVFWVLCFPRDWRRIARWVALMALAAVPLAVYVATIHFWEQGHTDSWLKPPTLSEFVGDLFADDAVGMTYQLNATPTLWEKVVDPVTAMKIVRLRWTVGRWWIAAVLLSVVLLTGMGFWRKWRARTCAASGGSGGEPGANGPADAPIRWNFFLLLWFLLPPAMLYLASLVWRPCIMPRYTLHSSLALYLVFAGAITMVRWRAVRAALVILLIAFYGYQHSMVLGDPQHPDWKSACARLRADANADDLVLVHNWLWKRVFAYNLGPVPNVVSYGTGYDVLAEECAFFTDLSLPSKSGKGPRIPWVLVQTEYFLGGPIRDLETEFRARGLSFQSWEYGGVQHVLLYRVWREPGAAVPDYHAKALSGEPPREFGDLSLEYWRAGEYGTAELAARRAIALDPKYTKAWSYLGMALKEAGRKEEALAAFQEAVRLDFSGYPWSHVNIAMLLLDLGRYEEAIDATLRALELLPNDAWAHTVLASAYLGAGRVDDAIKTAEKAVSLDPNDRRSEQVLEKARAAKSGAAQPQ